MLNGTKTRGALDTQDSIKKIVVGDEVISIWKGKTVDLYRHYPEIDSKTPIGSVPCDHDKFTVDKNGLYVVAGNQLDVFSHEGVKKQNLTIHSSEPGFITSKSEVLAIAIANEIKVYDIQRREPRLTLTKQLSSFAKITSIKINSDGSMLAIQGISENTCGLYVFNSSVQEPSSSVETTTKQKYLSTPQATTPCWNTSYQDIRRYIFLN
jgi:hypothetical protein